MGDQNYQLLVISLERSHDRRVQVKQELSKTKLNWNFINAIDGSKFTDFPIEYNHKKVLRLLGYELSKNEIGCFLSHKEAWKSCVSSNKITIVLEDDFCISNFFEQGLDELYRNQNQWDLIRLQALYNSEFSSVKKFDLIEIIKNKSDPVGATAYILKPEVAKKLINSSNEIYEPVDHFLEHTEKHGVQMLATFPYLICNSGISTTISDRPIRDSVKGFRKITRSIYRQFDRWLSPNPWFPR